MVLLWSNRRAFCSTTLLGLASCCRHTSRRRSRSAHPSCPAPHAFLHSDSTPCACPFWRDPLPSRAATLHCTCLLAFHERGEECKSHKRRMEPERIMARQRRGSVSAEVPHIHRGSLWLVVTFVECLFCSQQKRRGVSAGVCARLCTFAAGLVCTCTHTCRRSGLRSIHSCITRYPWNEYCRWWGRQKDRKALLDRHDAHETRTLSCCLTLSLAPPHILFSTYTHTHRGAPTHAHVRNTSHLLSLRSREARIFLPFSCHVIPSFPRAIHASNSLVHIGPPRNTHGQVHIRKHTHTHTHTHKLSLSHTHTHKHTHTHTYMYIVYVRICIFVHT